jgi:hypothetical protein
MLCPEYKLIPDNLIIITVFYVLVGISKRSPIWRVGIKIQGPWTLCFTCVDVPLACHLLVPGWLSHVTVIEPLGLTPTT